MHKIIIVGGGAAGMLASIAAKEKNIHGECEVHLYDGNEKLGKKLFITGKGRCNVTSADDMEGIMQHVVSNPKFLFSVFSAYTNEDIIHLLNEQGVDTKVERGNRVFPVSDHSSDVITALERKMKQLGVFVHLFQKVKNIVTDENGKCTGICLQDGTKESADAVILATGGNSYQTTGSTGDGYRFAEMTGHKIIPVRPALVPLVLKEEQAKEMQGLSLKNVKAAIYVQKKNKRKEIYADQGELMFTHFGVTGPLILSGSSYAAKEFAKGEQELQLVIDLKPALSKEMLDKRILRDFEKHVNKNFNHSLDELLPRTMIPVIIENAGIDPYKKVNAITKEERERLVNAMKEMTFTITGSKGFREAIITQGGISVKDINPKTMESKKINHLFFAGEVIDVDAKTGGYNLQIAWSTGFVAGIHA